MAKPQLVKVANTLGGATAADDGKALIYDHAGGGIKWGTVASGSSSSGVSALTSLYTSTGGETSIPINLAEYNKDTDILEVYQDGVRIFSDAWLLASTNTSIDLQGYTATAGEKYHFVCLKPKMAGGGELFTITRYGGISGFFSLNTVESTIAQF